MIGVDSDTIIGGDESRQHGGKFKVSALRGVNIDSGLKSIILTAQTEIALITSSFGSIDIKAGTVASIAGVASTTIGGATIVMGQPFDPTTIAISMASIGTISTTTAGLTSITSGAGITLNAVGILKMTSGIFAATAVGTATLTGVGGAHIVGAVVTNNGIPQIGPGVT